MSADIVFKQVVVSQLNYKVELQKISESLTNATCVAIDLEYSGFANGVKDKLIDKRYASIVEMVKNHSLFQIGLSIYHQSEERHYRVETFSIDVCRADTFHVTADSLAFLSHYGMDMNAFFKSALKYLPVPLRKVPSALHSAATTVVDDYHKPPPLHEINDLLSQCITDIISSKVPLILHNGWIDLCFLQYHFLVDPLPASGIYYYLFFLSLFCAFICCYIYYSLVGKYCSEASILFPLVYDTKVLCSELMESAVFTSLEYVYHKLLFSISSSKRITILFDTGDNKCSVASSKSLVDFDAEKTSLGEKAKAPIENERKNLDICKFYERDGYCRNVVHCKYSHDVRTIVKNEMFGKKRKREGRIFV